MHTWMHQFFKASVPYLFKLNLIHYGTSWFSAWTANFTVTEDQVASCPESGIQLRKQGKLLNFLVLWRIPTTNGSLTGRSLWHLVRKGGFGHFNGDCFLIHILKLSESIQFHNSDVSIMMIPRSRGASSSLHQSMLLSGFCPGWGRTNLLSLTATEE